MMQDLRKRIRYVREKKGITLNAFANQLGVSSGYLSNLERGKKDNIELHLLEKIQKELLIFSMVPPDQEEDQRISVIDLGKRTGTLSEMNSNNTNGHLFT